MKLKCLSVLAGMVGLLSGCYFNSAGFLFDKADYRASVDAADVKVGDVVYCDASGEYYVELPRYRYGKPIRLNYFYLDSDKRVPKLQDTGQTDVFRIPYDFAMYLMGQADQPTTPSFMKRVDDGDAIKTSAASKYPIVRKGASSEKRYRYSSPNAAWWYTAGVFEWLCVDLPMTCVENSLVFTTFFAGKTAQVTTEVAMYYEVQTSAKKKFKSQYPCETCGGTGMQTREYGVYNGFGNRVDTNRISDICSSCGGDGISAEGSAAMEEYMQQYVKSRKQN